MSDAPMKRADFDQVMVPNYAPQQMIPVRGDNAEVWDSEGKHYIDFTGGIAVNALGHCHPHLLNALTQQAQQLWHLSNVYTNQPALQLAARLTEATFAERVFFCNSGGEANEAAFKLVRKYAYDHVGPEKHEIIAFDNAFHGRSLFTVSVGGQKKYREGFEPVPGGITHVSFNDIEALSAAISEKTCAVVMEPIQGESGVVPANPDFVRAARALCDQHGALLVFDEIQTGVGRTGALYAYQGLGVTPDVLTTAKALGGGFPIGAMLTTEAIAKSLGVGTHGSTYGGNPLACAVGNAVLETVNKPELLEQVTEKHHTFLNGLCGLNEKYAVFSEVRGRGLLLGAQLRDEYVPRLRELMGLAVAEGVMVLQAGPKVLRMAPSLIIPNHHIQEGLNRLDLALARFVKEG